jgi:phosphoglycerate dehydrogenase-like enzyme
MPTVLITDSLFFFKEHEQQLKAAGYDFERLDKPDATEEELVSAVKGKVGYLFGGIERVTQKVIDAADELKVISVAAIDIHGFVPALDYATEKGVAVTNTPDGPTNEAAEWAVTAALMMTRNFLELGRVNPATKFMLTKGLENQNIGIVGLGRIGSRIAAMVQGFRPNKVSYYSPHRHEDKEKILSVNYLNLSELLAQSDVLFLCVDGKAKNFFGAEQFQRMKPGSLLVNITHPGVIDEAALYEALSSEHIRAVSDHPTKSDVRFTDLPLDRWYCMNTSNTITEAGAKLMSDTATESLINVLTTGKDKYLVNPDYLKDKSP